MQVYPIEYENIIVGITYNELFQWYVAPKEYWFMDLFKLYSYEIKKINELNKHIELIDFEYERRGIDVLDETSYPLFAERMSKYRASVDELRILLELSLEEKHDHDTVFYRFFPVLYINFDNKHLYSLYSEPASFEDYVPQNWIGEEYDFLHLIEYRFRYWYNKEGFPLVRYENDR